MASIVERKNKAGAVTSYQVKWRHKGQQESESFGTRREAEMFKKVLEANDHDGARAERKILAQVSDSPKMAEVAEAHMLRLTDIAVHTKHTYERMLVNHINPVLGDIPVDMLTEEDVAEWVQAMRAKDSSPKTISNVHGLLYSIVETAIYKKWRGDNPCKQTRLPKNDHTEDTATFLTKAEFAHLMEHLDPHFHPIAFFLVGTGLRFSEATALTSSDFSDEGGLFTVRVTKAWKRDDKNGRTIGPPKSRRARRTVPMAAELAHMVAPLVRAAEGDQRVFRMKQGGEMTVQAMHNKAWGPAIKRAQADGFKKKPRLHDLRHTYASWMLAQGMDLLELSRRMGHEQVSTTTEVYSHLLPDSLRTGAEIAGAAMAGLFGAVQRRELEPAN